MFAFLSRLLSPRGESADWMEPEELRRWLASAAPPLVLDVRGPDEFDGPLGHIDGAVNIPLGDLSVRRQELAAAQRPIVTVCLTDKRSAQAAAELSAAGIKSVAVLRGGMRQWRAASDEDSTAALR
jgi:rhodanese-related sulfurtransferase